MAQPWYHQAMNSGLRQTTTWLTAEEHQAAPILAARHDMSLKESIAWCVRDAIEHLNKPSRN